MKEYAYQNLSIDTLPEEKWKELPLYGGYYEVSNLGRVRSVDRIVPHPRLYQQSVRGRILKQKQQSNTNKKVSDTMVYLQATFSFEGKMYIHNVRRLVYATFIDASILSDSNKYIININCDGLDNRLVNLALSSPSEKQKRVVQRDRIDNTLKTIDRSKWGKNSAHINRQKRVAQYSMNNELIKEYACINDAHRETGFDPKAISHTARGLYKQWGGYKWKFI